MRRALRMLMQHRAQLDQLANALLRDEVLERVDIDRIMDGVPRLYGAPGGLRVAAIRPEGQPGTTGA